MAKVDVIQEISDSFGLIKKHYKEVIVPIVILLLFSAGASGGSYFSRGFGSSSSKSADSNSLIANAMSSSSLDSMLVALSGVLLAILAVVLVVAIVLAILHRALWLYVYGHFYSIINKKKITQDWQSRLKRFAVKAFVLDAFGLVLMVAIFAIPAITIWNTLTSSGSPSFQAALLASLGTVAVTLIGALLVLLLVGFFLTPLWVYYAMDGFSFFDSLGKSVSLVGGNVVTFLLLGAVFLLLGIGAAVVAVVTCCFSYVVSPIIGVFLSLLWGVTLMNVKAKLEK